MARTDSRVAREILTEPVLIADIEDLPPGPALTALARFSYASGAAFGPAAGPGPVVLMVEEGGLEFTAQGRVVVTRQCREPGAVQEIPEQGVPFRVAEGDQLLIPGGIVHRATPVDDCATILGAAVFGDAPPLEFPPGITFQALALGTSTTLPVGAAVAQVTRMTYPVGAPATIRSYVGPLIQFVESGRLDVRAVSGELRVTRGREPPSRVEFLTSGRATTLEKGDGLLGSSGTVISVGDVSRPARVLEFVLAPRFTPAEPAEDAQVQANRDLLRGFVQVVIDGANPQAVGDFLVPNFVNHDVPPGDWIAIKSGLAGVQQFLESVIFPAFSDFNTEFADFVGQGDFVAGRWNQTFAHTGTYLGIPATGGSVSIGGISIIGSRHGRMLEQFEARDVHSWLEQIGGLRPLGALEPLRVDDAPVADLEELSRTFFYDAWSAQNLQVIDQIFDPSFVNHTLENGQVQGREGVKQFLHNWARGFPDLQLSTDVVFSERDRVVTRWTLRGTHKGTFLGIAPTARRVEITGISLFRVAQHRFMEGWTYWGKVTLRQQLGDIPALDPGERPPQASAGLATETL